jgi:hypothetical protein
MIRYKNNGWIHFDVLVWYNDESDLYSIVRAGLKLIFDAQMRAVVNGSQ